MKIFTIDNKDDEKFLRTKVVDFDFNQCSKKEIRELIQEMRTMIKKYDGVGLSANQLGQSVKMFIAQLDNKFYAIFNPKITKVSKETSPMEEGCLSVPNRFGMVSRPEKITLEGFDKNSRKIKIKAWGFLAKVFQHEIDHLEGKLFIDNTKEVYQITEDNKRSARI